MSKLIKHELVLSTIAAQYIANGDALSEYYLDFLGGDFAAALTSVGLSELPILLSALDIIAREASTRKDFAREDLVGAAHRRLSGDSVDDPGISRVTYGE